MDTTILALLPAVVILGFALYFLVGRLLKKARIQRDRKAALLAAEIRRTDQLMTGLPGQYLTKELHRIIAVRMDDLCHQLLTLRPATDISMWQDRVSEVQPVTDDSDSRSRQTRIDTPAKAEQIRELLQDLQSIVEIMYKTGKVDSASTKKALHYVRFLQQKSQADLHVYQAREAVRKGNIRDAIQAYHLASTDLGKCRDHPLAMKAIKSFRTRIRELEVSARDSDGHTGV